MDATTRLGYLNHTFDQIALSATPTLMAPLRGEIDWPLEAGSYRYLMGRDGLYLEGRSEGLHVAFRNGLEDRVFPYGPVTEHVTMAGGLIPKHIREEILAEAKAAAPNEWACYVIWNKDRQEYELIRPKILSVSGGHIDYRIEHPINEVVLDLHTHGRYDAHFSHKDNHDDRFGVYLAVVLGHCDRDQMSWASRIVVHGHHCNLNWLPWEE